MGVYTLTYAKLKAAAGQASGKATPDTTYYATWGDVANAALVQLAVSHPWEWRTTPLVLSYAPTAISSMARSSDIVTVTTSSAHGVQAGDTVRISGSAAVTDGFDGEFTVLSTTTLAYTFYQDGADESATTAGSFYTAYLPLAEDFGQMIILERVGTWQPCVTTNLARIKMYRAGSVASIQAPTGVLFAVTSRKPSGVTAAPRHALEIWPTPSATERPALIGTYRRLPAEMTADTDVPDCPASLHPCLNQLVRAMARHGSEQQMGQEWDLYNDLLAKAKDEDGGILSNLGSLPDQLYAEDVSDDHLYPTSITAA